MSSSSSHRHHHRRSASNGKRVGSLILAFLIFIAVFNMSLAVCMRTVITNPNVLAGIFTNRVYVTSLYDDVLQYAYDTCEKCSIPKDSADEVISYNAINTVIKAYAVGNICTSEEYTATTYQDKLEELQSALKESTDKMLKKYGLKTDTDQESGAQMFAAMVTEYTEKRMTFDYMQQIQYLVSIGKVLSIVMMVASALITLILMLILFSIETKAYLRLRFLTYPAFASALLYFVLVGGGLLVRATKHLYIYPQYLADALLRYVDISILGVFVTGLVMFVIGMLLLAIVWRIKRNADSL